MNTWSTIILAAGKGTRLKSDIPKPLVDINGKKLIEPILENAQKLTPDHAFIAIADATKEVATTFPDKGNFIMVEGKGTGADVASILPQIETTHVLIAQADDSHFYSFESLKFMMEMHVDPISVAVAPVTTDMYYSSVITEGTTLVSINRDKSAPSPKHVFCGLYTAETAWLREEVSKLTPNEDNELPLPGVVDAALHENTPVNVFFLPPGEWVGVNTPEELEAARARALTD